MREIAYQDHTSVCADSAASGVLKKNFLFFSVLN